MSYRVGLSYFQEGFCTAYVARKGSRWDPVYHKRIGTALLMNIQAEDGTGAADHQWFDLWEFRGLMINSGDTVRFYARRKSYQKHNAFYCGHPMLEYKLIILEQPEKIIVEPIRPLAVKV
jgi:hypothetical protein